MRSASIFRHMAIRARLEEEAFVGTIYNIPSTSINSYW